MRVMQYHNCHTGIIIHSYFPYQYRYIIFDEKLGKIDAFIKPTKNTHQFLHGMMIQYCARQAGNYYWMNQIDIIDLLRPWVTEDLSFFHYILELFEHCVPYDQPCKNLYNLLYLLYYWSPVDQNLIKNEDEMKFDFDNDISTPPLVSPGINYALIKIWWLCQFFTITGLYPDDYATFSAHMLDLISSPFDIMVNRIASNACDRQELIRWLKSCRKSHAPVQNCKTDIINDIMDISI